MKNNWEIKLKNKLQRQTGDDFDQRFWQKFEAQNPASNKSWNWQALLPIGSIAALAAMVLVIFNITTTSVDMGSAEVAEMVNNMELLENLDLVSELDVAELSEEEWNILLGGQS